MKNYIFHLPKIETRSQSDGKTNEYIVRGYASVPNKLDIYKVDYGINGPVSFRSLFTENAVQSMEKQAKSKKIFVDVEHETGSLVNIKHILDNMEMDPEKKEEIMSYVKHSDLPFAKVFDLKIDDNGLFLDTRLNPHYKNVHGEYFDAIWKSMQDKFINGMSINFAPTKTEEKFLDGRWVDVIDDVELYGISYTGNPALPENNIVEVAMRSALDFKKGERMEEKKEVVEPIVEVKEVVDKVELEKVKSELEQLKQNSIEKEKEEHQKSIESLQKELEEVKKSREELAKEVESSAPAIAKGVVSQLKGRINDSNFAGEFRDKLKDCTLAEGLALQDEFKTMQYEDPLTLQFLGRGKDDIVVSKNKK